MSSYFKTSLNKLGSHYIFPFHVYLYHPLKKKYSKFLEANLPMSSSQKELLKQLEKIGASICIRSDQKLTYQRYINEQSNNNSNILENSTKFIRPLISTKDAKKELESLVKTHGSLKQVFQKSLSQDHFENFIKMIKLEIISSEESPRASMLANHFLGQDTYLSRLSSCCYLMTKISKNSVYAYDAFIACFLSDLGQLQFQRTMVKTPYLKQSLIQKKTFKKHPIHSQELLNYLEIKISKIQSLIIADHHERSDSSGYPGQKSLKKLEKVSLYVALIHHLFEFSYGYLDGKEKPLKEVFNAYKAKKFIPGLDKDFGFSTYKAFLNFLENDFIKMSAS